MKGKKHHEDVQVHHDLLRPHHQDQMCAQAGAVDYFGFGGRIALIALSTPYHINR